MVSDQEILSRVEQLLRRAPAAAANVPAVVRHLETSFGGVDLSSKASLIRDQIELLAAPPPKDHFALHPFPPYFHQHQISPFTHLPQHHEFAFRYGARPPHVAAAMEAAAAAAAIHHHQQQLLLFGNEQEQQKRQLQIHVPEQERDQHQHHHQPQLNCVEQPQRGEHDQHHQQVGAQHLEQEQEKRQPVQQVGVQHLEEEQEKRQPVQQQEPAAPAAAAPTAAKEGASTGVKRRGGPGGLNKVCRVTPELQTIVGEPTMARTEIVKQLWAYIRRHNLQDPNNKRKIICNDELRLVFETDCTDMFKMNKLLAKHIITLEPTKSSGPDAKKLKAVAEVISATEYESGQDLVTISGALANFFGTGETEMLEVEASRRVWDYIKANHLEDPMNPMMVLCDSKLQLLLGDESLSAFGLQDKLMRHLFKQSNKDNIN